MMASLGRTGFVGVDISQVQAVELPNSKMALKIKEWQERDQYFVKQSSCDVILH